MHAAATREAFYMLGLNPSQHDLVNAAVVAASTGSPVFPRMVLPDSPRASSCTLMPNFHVYPQASHLSGDCSPEVSMTRARWLVIRRREETRAADASRRAARRTQPVRRNADRRRRGLYAELDLRGWYAGRWL
ncbi:putative serine/threonine-protein kinase [Hordeum vulgare]|nr:putative serine/threonine-protein kinase [Hordeum vulgare]